MVQGGLSGLFSDSLHRRISGSRHAGPAVPRGEAHCYRQRVLELPQPVLQALLDAGVARADVHSAWASLSARARHGLGLARRLLERGAASPEQLQRALGQAPRATPQPRSFGAYTVVRPLGRGAMGEVLLVVDPQGREFALKKVAAISEPLLIQRFQREVRALAALRHPHLVRIHDAGVVGQTPYLVMDHYPGGSLQDLLAEGPLDPERARTIAGKLAAALEAVHAQGLVHRDLKPENVLIDDAGEPRLADFGLVTAGERSLSHGPLTLSQDVIGTPNYMAPEQALDSKEVGPAADVYALGGVLFAMLTGRPPFPGKSVLTVLEALVNEAPPAPRKLVPGVPPELDALCLRALSKRPADRPPSAAAFADELEGLAPFPLPAWVLGLVACSAFALCAAVGLVLTTRGGAAPAVDSATAHDPGVTAEALAAAGLLEAAWAAWSCEGERDADWTRRGEVLLVAGVTPNRWELEALGLDAETESLWLLYLSARDMISPRPLPGSGGRLGRFQELIHTSRRLLFAPGELRNAFVALDEGIRKGSLVTQMEQDSAALLSRLERAAREHDPDSPVPAALLDLTVTPLAQLAIYRCRDLDDDPRVDFSHPVPVDEILALRSLLTPGSVAHDALELAAAGVAHAQHWEDEGADRAQMCRELMRRLDPFLFERLKRLSVQLQVWTLTWLVECWEYLPWEEAPPLATLDRELGVLQRAMDRVLWQSQALDGRRHLDEDEFYRYGTRLRLLAQYPREAPRGAWPEFSELARTAERACGANPHEYSIMVLALVCYASGDPDGVRRQLGRVKERDARETKALLRIAADLLRARHAASAEERAALLLAAERTLESQGDWNRGYWAAKIDLLGQRGASVAELEAAEEQWRRAARTLNAPAPYLLFEPGRRSFVPRPGATLIPVPPLR